MVSEECADVLQVRSDACVLICRADQEIWNIHGAPLSYTVVSVCIRDGNIDIQDIHNVSCLLKSLFQWSFVYHVSGCSWCTLLTFVMLCQCIFTIELQMSRTSTVCLLPQRFGCGFGVYLCGISGRLGRPLCTPLTLVVSLVCIQMQNLDIQDVHPAHH
jgi:hypothetical protein